MYAYFTMEYVIDAANKPMGRVASEAAIILQGKKSPSYDPRLLGEDKVKVINIDRVVFTGKKEEQKIYYHHTGYMGHLKSQTLKELIGKKGKGEALKKAVSQMLPKNKLRVGRMKRLVVE